MEIKSNKDCLFLSFSFLILCHDLDLAPSVKEVSSLRLPVIGLHTQWTEIEVFFTVSKPKHEVLLY